MPSGESLVAEETAITLAQKMHYGELFSDRWRQRQDAGPDTPMAGARRFRPKTLGCLNGRASG